MVSANFLIEVLRILKVRGFLRLVTDDPDYARAIELRATSIAAYRRAEGDLRNYPPTEFQIKFLADSRPVYGLVFERLN
jgi:tRNA G46 methylase TrmB